MTGPYLRTTSLIRRVTSLGLVGVLLLVAAPTVAQDSDSAGEQQESSEPKESEKQEGEARRAEKAKKVFDRGMEHYVAGEYTKAIVEFKRAHNLYPSATLLYNIAMARMNLGEDEKAAGVARNALDFDGEPLPDDSRAQARGVVDGSGVVTSARGLVDASTTSKDGSASPSAESSEGAATAPPPKTDRSTSSGGKLGVLGWSGIALGGVGVAGLVGLPILASNYDQQVQRLERLSNGPSRSEFQTQRDKVESTRTTGRLLTVAAPTVTALGVGLLAVDLLVLEQNDRRVSAGVGPTGRLQVDLQW